jgi:hypothetical protein
MASTGNSFFWLADLCWPIWYCSSFTLTRKCLFLSAAFKTTVKLPLWKRQTWYCYILLIVEHVSLNIIVAQWVR